MFYINFIFTFDSDNFNDVTNYANKASHDGNIKLYSFEPKQPSRKAPHPQDTLNVCEIMTTLLNNTADLFCDGNSDCFITKAPATCQDQIFIRAYLEKILEHVDLNNRIAGQAMEDETKTTPSQDIFTSHPKKPTNYTAETEKAAKVLRQHVLFIQKLIDKIINTSSRVNDNHFGNTFKMMLRDLKSFLMIGNIKDSHILQQWHKTVNHYQHNYELLNSI